MKFVLLLMITVNREGVAWSVPGFDTRGACESTGAAFLLEAKKEPGAKYYCVPVTPR
jgi:hypothetical protein